MEYELNVSLIFDTIEESTHDLNDTSNFECLEEKIHCSRIGEVLQILFDELLTEREIQSLLLRFRYEYEDCIRISDDFCQFDVLCMQALEYAYEINNSTKVAALRSVYCYFKGVNLNSRDRNVVMKSADSTFVKDLRNFTYLKTAEIEYFLTDALIKSFLGGNLGLSAFLIKFGLIEFPSEADGRSGKIVRKLLEFFNDICSSRHVSHLRDEETVSVQFDDLFNQMQQNKNTNFRRLLLILCYICNIANFRISKGNKISDHKKKYFRCLCRRRLLCLDLFIEMTTESLITFKDVDKFLSTILNRQLNETFHLSLLKATRKMFPKMYDYYNPRPLKHLARSKIRECIGNSMVLPEGVEQLPVPVTLKDFLTFEKTDIWNTLINDQRIHYFKKNHYYTYNY